jgi:hypothetical protein
MGGSGIASLFLFFMAGFDPAIHVVGHDSRWSMSPTIL